MKKMLFVSCMLVLVASGAWAYPGPNSMGIYMDAESGDTTLCADVGQYQPLSVYLVLTNPTGPQVASWEGQLEILPAAGAMVGSWVIPAAGINVGSGIDFIVGHGAGPLQPNAAGNIMLMSMDMTIIDNTVPIEFYLRRLPDSLTFSDGPGYAYDAGFTVPCVTSTGGPTTPIFIVNPTDGNCIITGNEDRTWGSVKALYQ